MCLECVDECIALQLLKEENYPQFADADSVPQPFLCHIECKTCTMISSVRSSSEFPRNEALQALVEKVSKYKKCSLPRCNQEPEVDCVACQRSLCLDCFTKLHNLIEEHDKSELGTIRKLMVNTCFTHNKPFEYFCRTCDTQLCKLCLRIGMTHRDHDVTTVAEYAHICAAASSDVIERSGVKQEKMSIKGSVVQSMSDKVKEVHENAERTITDQFDRLIRAVEERRNQLLEKSTIISKAKVARLDQQTQCINAMVSQLGRYTSSLRTHVKMNASSDIIYSKQRIDDILGKVDSLFLDPCYNENVNLFADVNRLVDVVMGFGSMNCK
jgi:outer membrane murein-binding lipoprotein Lpp